MKKKRKVAVFASHLTQENPRGAVRACRLILEHYLKQTDDEVICLVERTKRDYHPVFEYVSLEDWLNIVPKEVAGGSYTELLSKARGKLSGINRRLQGTLAQKVALEVFRWGKDIRSLTAKRSGEASGDFGPKYISLDQIDVLLNFWWFHSEKMETLSLSIPKTTKMISWFLDAIPLRIAMDHHLIMDRAAFFEKVDQNMRKSDHVICISNSSREDASLFFQLPDEKLSVVPCGVIPPKETNFDQNSHQLAHERLRERFAIHPTAPIFSMIGITEPSKNVHTLLKAAWIALSKNHLPDNAFQLVLVGDLRGEDLRERFGPVLDKLASRIKITYAGFITDEERDNLLRASHSLVYPSLWEGFGLPPLEAMVHECLVVSSNVGPLPEVCGEHAIYCDPFSPLSIAEALKKALDLSPEERQVRVAAARRHAEAFSWDKSGKALQGVIDCVSREGEAQIDGPASAQKKLSDVPTPVRSRDREALSSEAYS